MFVFGCIPRAFLEFYDIPWESGFTVRATAVSKDSLRAAIGFTYEPRVLVTHFALVRFVEGLKGASNGRLARLFAVPLA